MLKNILKLDGAQELTKNEQKSINGGLACGSYDAYCPTGTHCVIERIDEPGHVIVGLCRPN